MRHKRPAQRHAALGFALRCVGRAYRVFTSLSRGADNAVSFSGRLRRAPLWAPDLGVSIDFLFRDAVAASARADASSRQNTIIIDQRPRAFCARASHHG